MKLFILVMIWLSLLINFSSNVGVYAGIISVYHAGDDLTYYPIKSNETTCVVRIIYQFLSDQSPPSKIEMANIPDWQINSVSSNSFSTSVFELILKTAPTTNKPETLQMNVNQLPSSTIIYSTYTTFICNSVALYEGVLGVVKSSKFAGQYYAIVKFTGIDLWDYQLIDGGSTPRYLNSKSLGYNYFLIQLSNPLFAQPYIVKIDIGQRDINFNFDYPYSSDYISTIKQQFYYPSDDKIQFVGIGVGIITIETPLQSLFIQAINSNYDAIKIGGSSTKSIYMLHFSKDDPTPSSYKVNIQNGDDLIEIPKSFNQSKILKPYTITSNIGTYTTVSGVITTLHNFKNIVISQAMKSYSPRSLLFSLGFPFGYIGGNFKNTNYSVSIFEKSIKFKFGIDDLTIPVSLINSDITPPTLLDYKLIKIDGGNRIIFQLWVSDDSSGVKSIGTLSSVYQIGPYIVSGPNTNCNLEIDMEFQDATVIVLCDNVDNCRFLNLDSYVFKNDQDVLVSTISPKTLLSIPNTFKFLQDISSISFKYNNLIVTGISKFNVMTIKLVNFPIDRMLLVRFYPAKDNQYVNENTPVYYARYNSDLTILAWQCEFIVPANIGIGELEYSITLDMIGPKEIYSFSLPQSYQLTILESQQFDFIGPIVTNLSSTVDKSNLDETVINGILTIEDSVNGYYGNGYILIRGSIDMTIRNVTGTLITGSGNVFKGDYQFSITIPTVCISQTYSIIYAKFIDSQGWTTIYDESNVLTTLMNPFYPLLDKLNFQDHPHYCDPNLLSSNGSVTLPKLDEFTITSNLINVIGKDEERIVSFSFTASHPDGVLSNPQPIVYLTSTDQEIVYSTPSDTIRYSQNATHVKFVVSIKIPYGFGYSKGILISLYGIVSNAGTHIGYTSSQLSVLGFPFIISQIYIEHNYMMITSTSQLSSNGGTFWIYGQRLDQVTDFQMIGSKSTFSVFPASVSKTAVQIIMSPGASPIILNETFVNIRLLNSLGEFSNTFKVEPFPYRDTNYLINPSIDTPTPIVTSTPTTVPCKSTCGISNNQGYCSSQGYCVCNSPYIGSDCSSTIIVIPPPTINETQPSTEIKIPNEEIKYSSIVSIVSIRELNFNSDEIYSYTFEKWVYTSILDSQTKRKYSYFSNITDSNNNVISNITAILEWNSAETTVEFAGQPITLLPSSIKYTIELSEYPFSSDLNSLQLIMSTSIIKSSDNDQCLTGKSNSEFGNSSSSTIENQNNSDSNYIELKVDNYLFYGRFIKRALIDGKPISVSNTKLSDDNIEVKLGSSSSKIGINIPWFESNAIIDPDFSLLVQSNSDDTDDCSDNGLTTSQLVGIIIGSVALFIILIIITIAIIYKSSSCFAAKILLYRLFKKSNKQ